VGACLRGNRVERCRLHVWRKNRNERKIADDGSEESKTESRLSLTTRRSEVSARNDVAEAECEESGAAEENVGAKLGWPPAMITAEPAPILHQAERKRARRPKLRRGAKGEGTVEARSASRRFAPRYNR